MIDLTLASLFIPTVFIISITPGMCMTLAMSLGMTIGVKKALWMMYGELIGVAIVAVSSVLGVSAILLRMPEMFVLLKVFGGCYLTYVGVQMWQNKGTLALSTETTIPVDAPLTLFNQGLITALANPKGWAFMVSLLPPFINNSYALLPQLFVLTTIILVSEFICMLIYAIGGKSVAKLISNANYVKIVNRLSGTLMIVIAIWLVMS